MIVLDTHIVFWLAQSPDKLSNSARSAITEERENSGLAIADKTLWEIAMLISSGQVRVRDTLRDFLISVERHFTIHPVNAAIAARSVEFSSRYPSDPADRLIGATALIHGQKLLTADKRIQKSGEVPFIW